MVLRLIARVLAGLAVMAAAAAAYASASWMPLMMTAPIALIVVLYKPGRSS